MLTTAGPAGTSTPGTAFTGDAVSATTTSSTAASAPAPASRSTSSAFLPDTGRPAARSRSFSAGTVSRSAAATVSLSAAASVSSAAAGAAAATSSTSSTTSTASTAAGGGGNALPPPSGLGGSTSYRMKRRSVPACSMGSFDSPRMRRWRVSSLFPESSHAVDGAQWRLRKRPSSRQLSSPPSIRLSHGGLLTTKLGAVGGS